MTATVTVMKVKVKVKTEMEMEMDGRWAKAEKAKKEALLEIGRKGPG